MAISKLGFATLVALLNIDFWAWDKPTTFGPDSCSTGLLEAWTLPSRETRPSALRFVGMERHDSETNSSDLLKTLENMKKTKGLFYWGWKKNTSSKTRIRMLRRSVGAILAKKYHHRVSSPLLRMLLHPSVEPKHTIGCTLKTPHKRHTKYKTLHRYRNV